jgi:SAM-dependent methyltransferase
VSLFYALAYRLGITPWEKMSALPIGNQVAALLDREQDGRSPPLGRALDLGCGSGTWSIDLARRGWEVTGVEIVRKALRRAREHAGSAGADVRLLHGDVTALREADVGTDYRFLFDLGTIHGLKPAQREAAGREATAVAAPDATLLTAAWKPGHRGPLPRGMSRDEIEVVFEGWSVIDEQAGDVTGAPGFVKAAEPRFYRLRRD